MLRDRLAEALKPALKERKTITVATLRLILAALKDRDIAARGKGNEDGISEDEILAMLQTMVRQRYESIVLYEQGGRAELADREQEEIGIIREFLPRQLGDDEIQAAVAETISQAGAAGLKDMGRVMAALRENFAGQMDFGKASAIVKERLAAT